MNQLDGSLCLNVQADADELLKDQVFWYREQRDPGLLKLLFDGPLSDLNLVSVQTMCSGFKRET